MTTLAELEAFLVSNCLSLSVVFVGSMGWHARLSYPAGIHSVAYAIKPTPLGAIEAAVAVFEARNTPRAKAV